MSLILIFKYDGRFMKTGILICGLNGVGKSTFGKALAQKLNFHFIDNEDLYFPKTDPNYMYAFSRSREEVEELLNQEIEAHENFVFVSVKGDYKIVEEGLAAKAGKFLENAPLSKMENEIKWYVILIEIPREIRLLRVRNRSFKQFGDRIKPGGDLWEKEERFFNFVESRPEDTVEKWVRMAGCSVIRLDGIKSVEENLDFCLKRFSAEVYNGESDK